MGSVTAGKVAQTKGAESNADWQSCAGVRRGARGNAGRPLCLALINSCHRPLPPLPGWVTELLFSEHAASFTPRAFARSAPFTLPPPGTSSPILQVLWVWHVLWDL